MIAKLKMIAVPFMALFALVAFFFRSRSTDKGDLEIVHGEAQEAKAEAITAEGELAKEKIDNETKEKLAAADALSDADIIADAISDYRAGRHGPGAGGEGQGADSQNHTP